MLLLALMYVFLTQCDSVTSVLEDEDEPVEQIESKKAPMPVIQIADTIKGKQGVNTNFILSHYFKSNAAFTTVDFSGKDIKVEEAGSDIYVISQPDSLFGEVKIEAVMINSASDTLSSELIYIIEAHSPGTF